METNKTAPQRGAAMKGRSKNASLIEVIMVQTCVGEGTEQNPNRIITEYWSKEGRLLAVNDPCFDSSSAKPVFVPHDSNGINNEGFSQEFRP